MKKTEEVGIRIKSDGTGAGTQIIDESGNTMMTVEKVEWSVSAGEIGRAVLTVFCSDIEITTKAEIVEHHPARVALHWRKPENRPD